MAYLVLVEGRWRLATPLLPDRDPTRLWCVGSGGEAHPVSLLSTCGDRPKAFVFEVTVTERPETRWMWALVDLAGPSAERVLHQPQALDDRMGAAGSTSTDRIVDRQNGRVAGRMSRPIDAMPLLARAAAAPGCGPSACPMAASTARVREAVVRPPPPRTDHEFKRSSPT